MKPRKQTPFLAVSITLVGFAFTSFSTHAATLTWDTTAGDGAAIAAGSGDWNLTAGNTIWNSAGTNVIWSQTSTTDGSNAAIFAGADGTLNQYVVTLGSQMAAESLAFNNSGYQITGSPLAVILSSTNNGSITVASGKTATINSQIIYNSNQGASITASGTLNLGGGATNSQYNFGGAGTVNITAGAYSANTGTVGVSALNQTGGNFNMTPGSNNVSYNIFSNARNVNYTISGTAILALNASNTTATGTALNIGNNTAGSFTSTLTLNGGTVNVGTITNTQGLIRISNSVTSNGKLDIQSGTLTVGTGKATNQITLFENGSSATYSATMTQSGGTVTTNGIQFGGTAGTYDAASSANLTLSGGSLYVGAAGITRGSAAATLPATIQLQGGTLGASQAWTSSLDIKLGNTGGGTTIRAQDAATTARNITLSGILSDDGAVNGTLTKTGTGTLTLSGANTFSGGVAIKSGILESKTTTTTLGTGMVVMGGTGSSGAVYHTGQFNSNAFRIDPPDSGTSVIGSNGTGSSFNLSGPITLNGANLNVRTFNAGTTASATLSGGVTGTGNLLLNNQSTTTGKVTLSGANPINNIGTITNQGVGTTANVISAVIGANVTSVIQNGPCPLVLQGANLYTGPTNVNAGTLSLGNVNAVSNSSSVTVANGAALELSTSSSTAKKLTFSATGTLSFNVASSYSLTVSDSNGVTNSGAAGSVTINITGSAPANGTYPLITYSGALQGSGFSAYVLGTTPAGKTYALDDTGSVVQLVVTSAYTWTGAQTSEWSTATIAGLKNWALDGSPADYANDFAVVFDDTPTNKIVNITGADVTPYSVLFNSGDYTLQSTTSNKIAGSAPVTVAFGATLKLGSSNVLPDGSGAGNLTVDGTLDLNGNSETINGFSGIGSVDNTAAATTSILTVGTIAGGNATGTIQNTGGTLALTKTGATDFTLSGANTYNGATTVNQNRLFISNSAAFSPNTTVTVNNGASFVLNASGTPTFAQSITLNSVSNLSLRQAATLSNVILPTSGGVIFNNDDVATQAFSLNSDVTLGGSLNVQIGGGTGAPGAVTLAGILSGSGSLVKSGSGTLSLSGSNSFNGGVTIKNGTLESKTTTTTLGTGTVTMGGVGSTGVTYITGQNNSNPFVINAPDSGTVIIGSNGTGSSFNLSGSITLNGANLSVRTFSAGTTANATLSGGVTGTGNLLINNLSTGTGKVTLSGANPINNIGTITSQGFGTTANVISASIGANVTGVIQNGSCPLTLSGANTYSGNTTVNAGVLTLSNAPDPLNANTGNDASTVTIAASGATLDLTYTGTDKVDKLFIGGVQQAAGVYGPSATSVPQITGTGTLTVLSGPSSAGYSSWATLNGASVNLNDDHDNDGVANGIEYFIGGSSGNTTGFTPLPSVTNTSGLLSVTWTKASTYTGVYGIDFVVETSATLAGAWATETLGGTVTITGNEVKYTFPAGTKNFTRLKVTGP